MRLQNHQISDHTNRRQRSDGKEDRDRQHRRVPRTLLVQNPLQFPFPRIDVVAHLFQHLRTGLRVMADRLHRRADLIQILRDVPVVIAEVGNVFSQTIE